MVFIIVDFSYVHVVFMYGADYVFASYVYAVAKIVAQVTPVSRRIVWFCILKVKRIKGLKFLRKTYIFGFKFTKNFYEKC